MNILPNLQLRCTFGRRSREQQNCQQRHINWQSKTI